MKLEHESKQELKKKILEIAGKRLNLNEYRIFFFGSRVSGKSDERSDIDIGIEGGHPLPSGVLSGIQEEIDKLPLLYKIEVVDFAKVSEKFKDQAKGHVEYV